MTITLCINMTVSQDGFKLVDPTKPGRMVGTMYHRGQPPGFDKSNFDIRIKPTNHD